MKLLKEVFIGERPKGFLPVIPGKYFLKCDFKGEIKAAEVFVADWLIWEDSYLFNRAKKVS